MDEHRVRQVALEQYGAISRRQVLAAGGTDRSIERHLASGRWVRVRRGVYIVGAAPSSWEQWAMAALLAAGPDAALGRRSAARAWGLVARAGKVQLVVADRRRVRIGGVEVHRPVDLVPGDLTVVGPLRTTSIVRTLIDLAPSQDAATMGSLVDAAIRVHGVRVDAIARRVVDRAGHGRPVPRSLIASLAARSPDHDPGRSALESRVIAALAAGGLPAPERQHRVVRADGRSAYLDLAYPELRIAIEVDGWSVHGQRSAFDADRARANDLVVLGWHLLRFTAAMSDAQVCATVATALEHLAPPGSQPARP